MQLRGYNGYHATLFLLAYLALQYLRAHARIDVDEDHPALVQGVRYDERSTPLSDVNTAWVLLGHGVPHLQERIKEKEKKNG